jgi:TonB-dependent receptor
MRSDLLSRDGVGGHFMQISGRAAVLFSSVSLLGTASAALAADQPPSTAPAVSEVVVTAAPRDEAKARLVQKDAINIIDVQSAETIAKYPDFNAAEALGRMPGISMSVDTGEGRYVNIRGIDSNLDGATFGGVPLLNDDPGGVNFGGGGRAVNFDTVPVGSVDGIILTKTLTPDHDAEGLGGTIELTPRTARDITQPFADSTLGWGYEDERQRTGPFDIDLAVGARFGFNNGHMVVQGVDAPNTASGWVSNPTPFSFVLTGSRVDDHRGFDDIEEDYTPNAAGTGYTPVYQDLQMRRYNYHRRRFGLGAEFDFKPNDNHSWYVRANEAGYTESVSKNRLTYDFSSYSPTPDVSNPSGYDSPADLTVKSTDEQETHRNQVYIAGGEDRFDGGIVVDYHASYSRASFIQGYDYGTTFSGPTAQTYFNNSANNGDFPVVQVTDGTDINDGALYKLKHSAVSNQQQIDIDEEYTGAANVLVPLHLIADDSFKAGFQLRFRDKTASEWDETDVIAPGTLDTASYGVPAITTFYGGRYTNGPGVNTELTAALAAAVDPGRTAATFQPGAYFSADENIYAAYAQYTTRIGPWQVLAGVRVEATQAKYGGYGADAVNNYPSDLPLTYRNENYTNVFPTLQARYNFTRDFLVRATYSTGISRPGFEQNTTASSFDGDQTITTGNPNLKPTTGDNFDLSFEYYLPRGGILQFGLFDKEFKNYIVTDERSQIYTDNTLGISDQLIYFATFSNIGYAYARGGEAAYHQQFVWLPGAFSGLGIESNLTLVDSRIQEYSAADDGLGHAQYGLLPGTSRTSWNLAGFYEKYGFESRIAAEFVSRELFTLSGFDASTAQAGVGKAFDTIQDDRLTVDYSMSYRLTPNWKVYFQAKNLTNAPLRFFIGSPNLPIQREFYEQTFLFGIKSHF